jgi:hypothetical protein
MRFRRILRTIIVIIKNFILGINIISLSLLRYPRNMMGYISECLFLFQTYSKNKIIPQKNVFQVLPGNDLEFGWTETWAAEEELGVLNFRGPEEPMIFLREPGDAEMPTTLTEPR